jgi:hypothetical protein
MLSSSLCRSKGKRSASQAATGEITAQGNQSRSERSIAGPSDKPSVTANCPANASTSKPHNPASNPHNTTCRRCSLDWFIGAERSSFHPGLKGEFAKGVGSVSALERQSVKA